MLVIPKLLSGIIPSQLAAWKGRLLSLFLSTKSHTWEAKFVFVKNQIASETETQNKMEVISAIHT